MKTKKSYKKPKITNYGNAEKITAGPSGDENEPYSYSES
jgi:hypothetical protein